MKQSPSRDWTRGALGLLLVLALLNLSGSPGFTLNPLWPQPDEIKSSTPQVFVEIKGDMIRSGLYCFQKPPSLFEALERAGVPLSLLSKGGKISGQELVASGSTIMVRDSDNGLLDVKVSGMNAFWRVTLGIPLCLNKESAEGLTALPGIGKKMAHGIVETRERLGGYTHLSQLRLVPGIGPKLLEKISPYLTLCTDSK